MKKLSVMSVLIFNLLLFSNLTVSAASISVTNINQSATNTPTTVLSTLDTTANSDSEILNVKDFGAKGDGVTDDSTAIQNAIDAASKSGKIVFFPESTSKYLINTTVYLKSNITISGYGATLYMPSQEETSIMLTSRGTTYIKDVTIEGISLESDNDRDGIDYQVYSKTSNVQGIYIQGISNLTIKDVQMDNMYNGLKFNAADDGTPNMNLTMDNVQIYNSRTPIYVDGTIGFYMTNSVLDATGGATHWLHCIYISNNTDDFIFDNVTFQNSPGGGITIGGSDSDQEDPKNITIKNSTIENCNRGFNIYGGSNVTVENTVITRCNLGFVVHDGTNIDLSGITINNATQTASLSGSDNKGAFELGEIYDSNFSNITIDSEGMTGNLFKFDDQIQNLTLSELSITNIEDIQCFEIGSTTIDNVIFKDSTFEWSSYKKQIASKSDLSAITFINTNFIHNY